MGGNLQRQAQTKDFKDPFNAGQMVGMLVMLTFIESRGGIDDDILQHIKLVCANNAEIYLNKPTEDIFLMVDNMVKEIEQQ